MLITLPDVLTADQLRQARAMLDDAPWGDGRDGAGTQARQVKNNEHLPHDCEAASMIRQMVLGSLDRNAVFMSATLPRRIFMPRVNRYTGSANYYGNHVDGALRVMPGTGQRVRTDVSCTVFLSEPHEYEGGELCIQHAFGEQAVKMPAGHAVLYPGTSIHQVRPVTRGARMGCFFWIESMIRLDEQRSILYHMDMALTSLRQRHGESEEAVALTSTYHNLLRLWAQT